MYQRYGKRPMDICLSLVALVVLSPVLLLVAILVRTKLGKPVLFTQPRPGKDESVFRMLKFRSMTNETDEHGQLQSDEIRLTPFGKWLRSTSLDELPGLFNIIKGDMSIVGPRPLLVEYLPLYTRTQRRRHEVRPGLTGLAQVSGRNALTWDERFKLDVKYVDQIGFWSDWKIISLTFLKVVKSEGISSQTAATMEVFKGSDDKGGVSR